MYISLVKSEIFHQTISVFIGEACSIAESHNASLNKHYITQTFNDPLGVMFYNQSIYRLRRLENQRTKTTAVDATGRAREFCWLLQSNWTRAV